MAFDLFTLLTIPALLLGGLGGMTMRSAWRRSGAESLRARRRGARVLAAQGGFRSLRAVLGPTFTVSGWGSRLARGWDALLGLGAVLVAAFSGSVAIAMSRDPAADLLRRETLEDDLTGVGNGRALFRSGTVLLDEATATDRPLALLVMNLDRLRLVNERHGQDAGDRLLVAFARLAHDYLPPTGLVCRLVGDDFAAVLPGADQARARTVADELRALFAHLAIEGPGGAVGTSVSIGIAQARPDRSDIADLLERADRSLAAAKDAGRDRVTHEVELAEAGIGVMA